MSGPTHPPALARRFLEEARAGSLLPAGSRVLVALSGGLDSVVLLHLLRQVAAELRLEVVAAHFDHAMRPGSEADALWVRGLCRAWGVSLHELRAEVPARSEAEARALRYAFLDEAAERAGATRIATAHHADDQAETVLFRAIRGTGLDGLVGIRRRRGRVVRPLLRFTRAELASYAEAERLSWREDPTNRDLRLARNRIRREVLPALERTRPGATRALARLAEQAAANERAWRRRVGRLLHEVVVTEEEGLIELARPVLLGYDPTERARLLRHLLRRYGSLPDRAGTRAALQFIRSADSGRAVHLPGGVRLEREYDRIRVRRASVAAEPDQPLIIASPGAGSGVAVLGGRRVGARWSTDGGATSALSIDVDAAQFPLQLRAWCAGDRVRLPHGSRKLKRLFADRRVARSERARRAVLVDRQGQVLWVEGLARAESARNGTVLHLELDDGEAEHGG